MLWFVWDPYCRCYKELTLLLCQLQFNISVLKVYVAPYQCPPLQRIPPKCCLVYPEGGAMQRNPGMLRKTVLNEARSQVNTPPCITTKNMWTQNKGLLLNFCSKTSCEDWLGWEGLDWLCLILGTQCIRNSTRPSILGNRKLKKRWKRTGSHTKKEEKGSQGPDGCQGNICCISTGVSPINRLWKLGITTLMEGGRAKTSSISSKRPFLFFL